MLKVKKSIKEKQEKIDQDQATIQEAMANPNLVFSIDWFGEQGWAKSVEENYKGQVGEYVSRYTNALATAFKKLAADNFTRDFLTANLTANQILILPGFEPSGKYKFAFENGALVLRWNVKMIAYSPDNFARDIEKALDAFGFIPQKSLNMNKVIFKEKKKIVKQSLGLKVKVDVQSFMAAVTKEDIKAQMGCYIYERFGDFIAKTMVKFCEDPDCKEALQDMVKKIVLRAGEANQSGRQKYAFEGEDLVIYLKPDMLAYSWDASGLNKFLMDSL